MIKYTIKKVFDKAFPLEIWKIAVDAEQEHIAIETRDIETTWPYIYILDFQGNILLEHHPLEEKSWTLDNIRQHTVVLKAVGDSKPVKEGIILLDLHGKERLYLSDFILLETYQQYIKVRHRSFQSGFEKYINLSEHDNLSIGDEGHDHYGEQIELPLPYPYQRPAYLEARDIEDILWVSRTQDKTLWAYHAKRDGQYTLNLCVANTYNILSEQPLISGMSKMLPQPFFQVRNQIFLMSYNKREIVSYLV